MMTANVVKLSVPSDQTDRYGCPKKGGGTMLGGLCLLPDKSTLTHMVHGLFCGFPLKVHSLLLAKGIGSLWAWVGMEVLVGMEALPPLRSRWLHPAAGQAHS